MTTTSLEKFSLKTMKALEVPHIIGRKRQDLHPHTADDGSEIAQEKEYSIAKRFKDMSDLPSTSARVRLLPRRFRNPGHGRLEYFRASAASSDVPVHEHGPAIDNKEADFGVALQARSGSNTNTLFEESFDQVRHDPESRPLDTQPLIRLDDMQPFPNSGFDRIGGILPHAQSLDNGFDQVRGYSESNSLPLPLAHDEIQFFRNHHAQSSDDVSQQGIEIAQNKSQESGRDGEYFTQPVASPSDCVIPHTFDQVQGNPELESSPIAASGVYNGTRISSGFGFGNDDDDEISLDGVSQNESDVDVWNEGEGVTDSPHCDEESYIQTFPDQATPIFDQTQAGYPELESLFPPVSSSFTTFDQTQAGHPELEFLPTDLSSARNEMYMPRSDSTGEIHTQSIDHASQTSPDVGVQTGSEDEVFQLHRHIQPDSLPSDHFAPNTYEDDIDIESPSPPTIPFGAETPTSSSSQPHNDSDFYPLAQPSEHASHSACSDLSCQIEVEDSGGNQGLGRNQNEFQLSYSNASLSIEPGTDFVNNYDLEHLSSSNGANLYCRSPSRSLGGVSISRDLDVKVDGSYTAASTICYSNGAEPSYIQSDTIPDIATGSYAAASTVFHSNGAEPSHIQPETQAASDHDFQNACHNLVLAEPPYIQTKPQAASDHEFQNVCHNSFLGPDSSYIYSDFRSLHLSFQPTDTSFPADPVTDTCEAMSDLRSLRYDDAEKSSLVRRLEMIESGMSTVHQLHDSGTFHEMSNPHGDGIFSPEHSQYQPKDGAALDLQYEYGIYAPGPHHFAAIPSHPKKYNGSDNGDESFSRDCVPFYCIQPEGEHTSDDDIVCFDAQGSLDYIQLLDANSSRADAEINECFQEQLDVSIGSLDASLPSISLDGPSSEADQERINTLSSLPNCEGLLIASNSGIRSYTPSPLDTPVAFGISFSPEEHMDVQLNLDDTEFDADDEGVKEDVGDSEMKYEHAHFDLDVSMADSGNGTQTFAYDNSFTDIPPAPTHTRAHVHDDPRRRTTRTTPDNTVEVPLASIQGNTLTPGPQGTRGDIGYQQGIPPLSPLTEIPDTPMVADTAEDERCLRTELESLVNNNVKSVSMKSHFISQMNQPPYDKAKLRSLLDSCYHYVGVLTNCDPPPPPPDIPVDTSHLSPITKPKIYKPPQHRPQNKVELAEHIRHEMGILMGRVNDRLDPEFVARPLSTVPSTTIDAWRRGGADGPTLENFTLQLCNGKHTHWNKAAAQVFSLYVRSKEEYKDYAIKSVQEAFFAHLSQLKKDFERQGRPKTIDEKDSEQRMRRMRRRNAELHRRMSSLKTILARYSSHIPKELHEVHKYITVECISGDESEPGSEANLDKVYYRTNRAWISQQFADFLCILRAWHIGSRYLGGGKYSNGRFPHPRYPSSRPESMFDSDIAPRGLPRNWYNSAWLMRNPSRIEILAVGPDVPLTLPQEEVRFAKRFQHVHYRTIPPLPEDHTSLDL